MNAQNAGTNGRNEYLTLLDKAWQQHLAPRELDAPTVISLFAGCGGSSLGYSMAGFRELLAVEWNDNAVETFKLNFPAIPVYHGDIHKLTVEQCLKMTGLQPGELDILDGSPPCQGFSTAGRRKLEESCNWLYLEYVRLLRGLQPKVFVMENVSGLVKGKMKLVFANITRELKASRYRVKCQLMNAMYFNVPQNRQRLVWIGVRNDLKKRVSFPSALNPPVTLAQACDGIAFLVLGQHGWYRGRILNAVTEPAPTLCKTGLPSYKYGIVEVGKQLDEQRKLYDYELKRIGSYSDGFKFLGQWENILACIGNSVPPLFMRAIAQHIRLEILGKMPAQATGRDPALVQG